MNLLKAIEIKHPATVYRSNNPFLVNPGEKKVLLNFCPFFCLYFTVVYNDGIGSAIKSPIGLRNSDTISGELRPNQPHTMDIRM